MRLGRHSTCLPAALLLAAAVLCCAWPAATQDAAADLDAALDAELQKSHYDWRFPRGEIDLENASFMGRFIHWAGEAAEGLRDWVKDKWERFQRWLDRMFGSEPGTGGGGSINKVKVGLRILVWALIALLAVSLLLFLARYLKRRREGEEPIAVEAPEAVPPDLEDEATQADALPEDEWFDLAGDCARKGDYRLGMRALLLAILAHLARHEFVRIAWHKSNLDYRREVERRDPVGPEARRALAEAVLLFESVWYGEHPAGREQFDRMWQIAQYLKFDPPAKQAAHG